MSETNTNKCYPVLEYIEQIPRDMLFMGFKLEYDSELKEYTLKINALNKDTAEIRCVQLNKFQHYVSRCTSEDQA